MEIIFGIIAGIITAMGMGGGTILILLLTLFLNINQHYAQGINLIFFIPTSLIAIIINIKNKNIDLKLGIKLAIFGICGALIGAMISSNLEVAILKKVFAIFLIFIAFYQIYEIYVQYKKNKKNNNNFEEELLWNY